MKSLSYLKKRVIILFVLLCIINSSFAQNFDQLFKISSGKYGTIKIDTSSIVDNIFELGISINWVDENLKPINDDKSLLVLEKSAVRISIPAFVKCESFNNRKFINIHDKGKLSFLVNQDFKGGDIKISLNFGYASEITEIENCKDFVFCQPVHLFITKFVHKNELEKLDKDAPEISINSPDFSRGFMIDVQVNTVDFSGIISDKNGIRSFTLNNQDVKFSSDGRFNMELKNLRYGSNVLTLKAIDNKSNVVTKEYIINYDDIRGEKPDGKYFALIIAIDKYEHINSLSNPISDGGSLKSVLVNDYTFEEENVTFLKNPNREQMIVALDALDNDLSEQDNLVIFYAGHGYWDESKALGYWLPADAKYSNTANWFRNSTIRDYIKAIDTKHTLLIADACFSGGIFRSGFSNASRGINRLYSMKSRKAMTSGTLKEVPDKSVFLKFLIKRLENNTKQYLPAEQLFASLKEAVLENSPNIPQYGTIQNSGDEGGDFIFVRRGK